MHRCLNVNVCSKSLTPTVKTALLRRTSVKTVDRNRSVNSLHYQSKFSLLEERLLFIAQKKRGGWVGGF